jgi:hypothetical protein
MKSKLILKLRQHRRMERFQTALRSVLSVSHDDLKQALVEDEKARRLRKDKP